ncbi:hypothetical protein C2S52_018660 [Perilla frutescens var. hirtella]|nr:hypothetical protein C2S52_018660 [Perilla frutescens var. hirtella]
MADRRAPAVRQNFNFRRTGVSSQEFQRNLYRDKFLDIGAYREKCSNSALCNSLIAKIEEYLSKIYPEAVVEFYVNSKGYDDRIETEVRGVELIITPELLGRLFNLPTTGIRVQDVQVDQEEAYRQWKREECLDVYKSSTLMSLLQEEYRILASVAVRMITGTTESHSEMSEHKYKICAAIIRGININWGQYFFEQIKKISIILEITFDSMAEETNILMIGKIDFIPVTSKRQPAAKPISIKSSQPTAASSKKTEESLRRKGKEIEVETQQEDSDLDDNISISQMLGSSIKAKPLCQVRFGSLIDSPEEVISTRPVQFKKRTGKPKKKPSAVQTKGKKKKKSGPPPPPQLPPCNIKIIDIIPVQNDDIVPYRGVPPKDSGADFFRTPCPPMGKTEENIRALSRAEIIKCWAEEQVQKFIAENFIEDVTGLPTLYEALTRLPPHRTQAEQQQWKAPQVQQHWMLTELLKLRQEQLKEGQELFNQEVQRSHQRVETSAALNARETAITSVARQLTFEETPHSDDIIINLKDDSPEEPAADERTTILPVDEELQEPTEETQLPEKQTETQIAPFLESTPKTAEHDQSANQIAQEAKQSTYQGTLAITVYIDPIQRALQAIAQTAAQTAAPVTSSESIYDEIIAIETEDISHTVPCEELVGTEEGEEADSRAV